MARYGWRPFFIVLGLVSMAWLIPWFAWMPQGKAATVSPVEKGGAGFLELLKQRSMWGTCGGLFGANYVLYFEITWLPYYLERERHFPVATMVRIVGVGYLCYSAGAAMFPLLVKTFLPRSNWAFISCARASTSATTR